MAYDVVKSVVVHFVTHVLDHVLRSGNDVLVKIVRVVAVEDGMACLGVKHERLASTLLKTSNVLNAEAIGVEPRQENVTNNVLHSFFRETECLGSHNGAVAKIETTSISTIIVSDQERIGVVLFRL